VILTDREIQIALTRNQIKIEPEPAVEAYSSTSVDLTLDPHLTEFRADLQDDDGLEPNIFDPGHKNFVAERTFAKVTQPTTIGGSGYILIPKKLVLDLFIQG
jgi:dCTP deaminase